MIVMLTRKNFVFLLIFFIITVYSKKEEESSGTYVLLEKGVFRCRHCGAKIASKSDYAEGPPATRLLGTKKELLLGEKGKTEFHKNPSNTEYEIALFKEADGISAAEKATKQTFYPSYSWSMFYCPICKRHIGWHYSHNSYEHCKSEPEEEEVKKKEDNVESMETIVDRELKNTCLTLVTGWWSYEYCHKKEVRQYHEEKDGKRPSDWSMGLFKKVNRFEYENSNTAISHLHDQGQKCDENEQLRSTTVIFKCCNNDDKSIHIKDINEPSLCKYEMNVCIPQLCPKDSGSKRINVSSKHLTKCQYQFSTNHEDKLREFYGLIWPNIIGSDSNDMEWTKQLKFISSLSK